MASGTRSNREERRAETKEDIKHLLEEVWDFCSEENFYKILSRAATKGIQDSIILTKEQLETLTWKEKNGDVTKIEPIEVGKFRRLKNYNAYREAKWDFTFDPRDLRRNTIRLEDWEDFILDPAITRTLESTGDMTSNPLIGLTGLPGSSSHQLTLV